MTEYTQAEVRAARALARRHAIECEINFDDLWTAYSDDFKADARAAIEASGLNASVQQEAQEPVATVIKRGASRDWMSERLGGLPDGVYSLYLAPQPSPASQGDALDAVKQCLEMGESFRALRRVVNLLLEARRNLGPEDHELRDRIDQLLRADVARAAQEGNQ